MGVIFYGDFKNDTGVTYRVNIHDDDFTGTASEVTLGADGFTLSYEGDQSNPLQRVISSSVRISVSPNNASFDTWVTSTIQSKAETSVKLEVRVAPTLENTLLWVGVVLVDQVRIPDSYDDLVELNASDGLAYLKKENNVHSKQPLIELLTAFLAELPTASFWSSGSGFLRYANDYYALGYSGTDYLKDAEARPARDHNNLDLSGNPSEFDTYQKIESLASAFNLRIFQANGYYWALPLTYYEAIADGGTASSLIRQVDIDGASVALTFFEGLDLNNEAIIEDGVNITRLRGGFSSHVAPKKRVSITRLTKGMNFLYHTLTPFTDYENISSHGATTNGLFYELESTFELIGSFGFSRAPDSPITDPDESLVTAYLRTTLDVGTLEYDGGAWQASASAFDIELTSFLRDSGQVELNVPISFITAPLTTGGTNLTLNLRIVFIDGTGADVSTAMESGLYSLSVALKLGNDQQVTNLVYQAETSDDNVEEVELPSTIFGSYPPVSSLMLLNGSIDADGSNDYEPYYQGYTWSGNPLAGEPLLSLVVSDALRMTRLPLETKSNRYLVVNEVPEMYKVLKQGSNYYAPFKISYDANRAQLDVERWKIGYTAANITTDDGDETTPTDVLSSFTSQDAVTSVNGVSPTGGGVSLDSDDIGFTGTGGGSVTSAIGANTSNIDLVKSYVVKTTDTTEVKQDADNKILVDGTSSSEKVTITTAGVDALEIQDTGLTTSLTSKAAGIELTSLSDSLILTDSAGDRWRVQVQTDGTLRTTKL